MNALLLLVLPLIAGTICLFTRAVCFQLALARLTALGMLGTSAALVRTVALGESVTVHFGGWLPSLGIAFEIDRLSALFSLLLSLVLVATTWTLSASREEAKLQRVLPAVLFLAAALAGAFATSDLFNLFVMFELVLVSSYLLLQSSGESARRVALPYVAMNVIAAALFFVGAGLLYTLGGSLSLRVLAESVAVDGQLGGAASPWWTVAVGLLTLAFATKAGLVPFMFWLPRAYPHLLGPIAALFAGMMTKLGVYALFRITPLMTGTALPELLVWLGAVSAVVGVLAAQAQTRFRELLCFHIVSQVGFMVVGVGLFSVAGLAGAVFYVAHHVMVKTALFLMADAADPAVVGSNPGRERAAASTAPVALAANWVVPAFVLAGLSLAGLPPLSGFVGKVAVFQALVQASRPLVVAALLLASLFTLVSVLKLWRVGFREAGGRQLPLGAALLVVGSLALAVLGGPAFDFAEATAQQILGVQGLARSGGAP